ncbi:hypothetical protein E3C22_12765 [Jiella endophytica]|uniref:Class I SAM-dependent methyltransferase n=1 Tax=Jiella endophytica TaxID=2558362 RepID=A0A4Y8RLF7_9HYPH|nr:hypothetical protein [Jiella endophytica]TFF23291.1 hypothetical protein E3C22_12765 [Jiella endophytica]
MTFIETGTFHGAGIKAALMTGFDRVVSIECVREFHDECSGRFASEIGEKKVELRLGDSAEELPAMVPSMKGPRLYWLDAHFQGVDGEFEAANCPLTAEIEAVIASRHPDDVIMIDDMRLLRRPAAWRGHKVEIDAVLGRLMNAYTDHVALFLDAANQSEHTRRDIFTLFPAHLAGQFFAKFPGGRDEAAIKAKAERELAATA